MPPMEDMVLNFLQPVIAEQLVDGARLFCVISNLTDDTSVQWLKNAKPLKQAAKYTVEIRWVRYKFHIGSLSMF